MRLLIGKCLPQSASHLSFCQVASCIVLDGDDREEAFREPVFPFRVLFTRIFLLDMHLKDSLNTVDGYQFEIFQNELRQQELNDVEETLQNKWV